MPDRLGRPTKIDRIIETRPDGTTLTVADVIIDRVRIGTPRKQAAASAGVAAATVYYWRTIAFAARTALALDPNHTLTDHEQQCLDFLERLEAADGQRVVAAIGRVQQAAQGGLVSRKTTTVIKYAVVNGVQEEVGREVTEVEDVLPPNWHASAWLLERIDYQEFARRTDVTVTTREEVPQEERARGLADAVRAVVGTMPAIEVSSTVVNPDVLTVNAEPV